MKRNALNMISRNLLVYNLIDYLDLEDLLNLINTTKKIRKELEEKSLTIFIFKYLIKNYYLFISEGIIKISEERINNIYKFVIKDDIRIKFKRLVHDDEFYNILFQFFKILIRNSDQKEISLKISKIH